MKQINSKISAKYNIGRYGNKGHYVEENSKRIFISNSSNDDYTNWLLAVDFAKAKQIEHKNWVKVANEHIKSWTNLQKQLITKKSKFTFDGKPLNISLKDIPKEKQNVKQQLAFWNKLKNEHQKLIK